MNIWKKDGYWYVQEGDEGRILRLSFSDPLELELTAVLDRLLTFAISERPPSAASQSAPTALSEKIWCNTHLAYTYLHVKGDKTWYAHKLANGMYCNYWPDDRERV